MFASPTILDVWFKPVQQFAQAAQLATQFRLEVQCAYTLAAAKVLMQMDLMFVLHAQLVAAHAHTMDQV